MQREQAQTWARDATEKLHVAERIGEHANSLLLQTQRSLARANERLDRCVFLLDATQGQTGLLNTIQGSLRSICADKAQSFSVLSAALESSLEDVNNVFEELKDVVVDKALQDVQERGRSRNLTLFDFVSSEILDVLHSCQTQLDKSYNSLELELDEQERSMGSTIGKFTKTIERLEKEVASAGQNDETWIIETLDEIRGFEDEIAQLLESVTAHYDQCMRGADVAEGRIEISEHEKKELFAVLENDVTEVPEVLTDLEEALGDIQQRCVKIEEHLAGQGTLYTQLKQLSTDLKTFGELGLTEAQKITSDCVHHFEDVVGVVNERCDEATELISHYHQFSRSYYALILELERRRSTQEAMYKLVEETQKKLQTMQEKDYRHRESFMTNNGSYLPSDLWSGFGNENPLFDMNVTFHDVPVVSRSTVELAKKVLR